MKIDLVAYEVQRCAVVQFSHMLKRYEDTEPEIRKGVDEMAAIIRDPDSTADEKMLSEHTMMESLFPSDAAEW